VGAALRHIPTLAHYQPLCVQERAQQRGGTLLMLKKHVDTFRGNDFTGVSRVAVAQPPERDGVRVLCTSNPGVCEAQP
jgi:hypothetical protein